MKSKSYEELLMTVCDYSIMEVRYLSYFINYNRVLKEYYELNVPQAGIV